MTLNSAAADDEHTGGRTAVSDEQQLDQVDKRAKKLKWLRVMRDGTTEQIQDAIDDDEIYMETWNRVLRTSYRPTATFIMRRRKVNPVVVNGKATIPDELKQYELGRNTEYEEEHIIDGTVYPKGWPECTITANPIGAIFAKDGQGGELKWIGQYYYLRTPPTRANPKGLFQCYNIDSIDLYMRSKDMSESEFEDPLRRPAVMLSSLLTELQKSSDNPNMVSAVKAYKDRMGMSHDIGLILNIFKRKEVREIEGFRGGSSEENESQEEESADEEGEENEDLLGDDEFEFTDDELHEIVLRHQAKKAQSDFEAALINIKRALEDPLVKNRINQKYYHHFGDISDGMDDDDDIWDMYFTHYGYINNPELPNLIDVDDAYFVTGEMLGHDQSYLEFVLRGIQDERGVPDNPHLCHLTIDNGFTPLHWAVMFDDKEVVQALLHAGADVDSKTSAFKQTALHKAVLRAANGNRESCVTNEQLDIIKLLLEANPDMEIESVAGITPLDTAVRWVTDDDTLYEIIELLVVNGADPNGPENNHGMYPDGALPVLAENIEKRNRDVPLSDGQIKSIRLLLAMGAKHVSIFNPNILQVVMNKRSVDINLLEDILIFGDRNAPETALELAANEGHVAAVSYLLGIGTQVNGVFKKGVFPEIDNLIDEAMNNKNVQKKLIKSVLTGSASDVKGAIEQGADVNIGVEMLWEFGLTPNPGTQPWETFIHVDEYNASGYLYEHYESRITEHDAVHTPFHYITTLLHIALLRLRKCHYLPRDSLEHDAMTSKRIIETKRIIELLVKAGADVNKKDLGRNVGDTPFHLALLFEEADLIIMMMDHGADCIDVDLRPVWASRLDPSVDLKKIPDHNLWGVNRLDQMVSVINAQLEGSIKTRSRDESEYNSDRSVRQRIGGADKPLTWENWTVTLPGATDIALTAQKVSEILGDSIDITNIYADNARRGIKRGMESFFNNAQWFEVETDLKVIAKRLGYSESFLQSYRCQRQCYNQSYLFSIVNDRYFTIHGWATDIGLKFPTAHACLCAVLDDGLFVFDLVRDDPLLMFGAPVRRDFMEKIEDIGSHGGLYAIDTMNYLNQQSRRDNNQDDLVTLLEVLHAKRLSEKKGAEDYSDYSDAEDETKT